MGQWEMDLSWHADASCRDLNVEDFYSDSDDNSGERKSTVSQAERTEEGLRQVPCGGAVPEPCVDMSTMAFGRAPRTRTAGSFARSSGLFAWIPRRCTSRKRLRLERIASSVSDNKANLLEAVFGITTWTTRPATVSVVGSVLSTMTRTRVRASIRTRDCGRASPAAQAGMVTRLLRLEGCSFADANRIAAGIYDGGDGEVRGSVSSITGSRLPAPKKHRSGKGRTYVPPWSRL